MTTPGLIMPHVAVEGDALVIRITLDTLCHAVTMADNWPTDCEGKSLATITDRALFIKELIGELTKENEQGATPLHFLFDESALAVIDAGSEAVDLREEDEGDE